MVKTLEANSTYEPSKRTYKWLKLKRDYLESALGDTLDLVPIGGVYGTGNRVGTYGTYLMATYDQETEKFQPISLLGSGFTKKDLEDLYSLMKDYMIEEPQENYDMPSAKLVKFL